MKGCSLHVNARLYRPALFWSLRAPRSDWPPRATMSEVNSMSLLRRPCPQKITGTQRGPQVPKASSGAGVCHSGALKVAEDMEIRLETTKQNERWLNGKTSTRGVQLPPGSLNDHLPRTWGSLEAQSHPTREPLLPEWGKTSFSLSSRPTSKDLCGESSSGGLRSPLIPGAP